MRASEPLVEPPATSGRHGLLVWTGVAVAAIAARVALWRSVFTSDGVRFLADGDPYYHVLRAQRLAEGVPHAAWQDPGLEHPLGAAIPWPPLLDEVLARIGSALAGGGPPSHAVNVVAAIAPVVLGVATVAATAWLAARLWGRAVAPGAALLVALAPVHVCASVVGRPDHHVVEVLLACLALAAWLDAWRSAAGTAASRAATLVAGLAVTAAFWVWPGSALDLALLASIAATAYIVLPGSDEAPARMTAALAGASGTAAVALAVTIAVFGAPGAIGVVRLTGVSGFHVLLCAGFAAFAFILASARRPVDVGARALVTIGAAVAAASAILAPSPAARAEVARALLAVGPRNPWYAAISEFHPILFSGASPLTKELWSALGWFGALPAFAILGVRELRDRWRALDRDRAAIVTLAAWAGVTAVLALARVRFAPYAAPPLAILAWLGIARRMRSPTGHASGIWGVAYPALAVAASCAGLLGFWRTYQSSAGNRAAPVLTWLSEQRDPVAARRGVLADWALGHHVQFFAHRPVVASPFGTELGGRGFEDAAAFFITADPTRAEALLDRRLVGYVLASDAWSEASAFPAFAAAGDEPVGELKHSVWKGLTFSPGPSYAGSMANRLHRLDGGPPGGVGSSLSRLRLLRESEPREGVVELKLYGVVAGASLLVSGAAPGTEVSVSARVRSDTGRVFTWSALASAAPDGHVAVRVPYATGPNGSCSAEEYVVSAGARRAAVNVPEGAVVDGSTLAVALPRDEPRRGERAHRDRTADGNRLGAAPRLLTPGSRRASRAPPGS